MLLTLWFVFTLTLSVFPGTFFEAHFSFMDGMKDQATWYNILMLILFNIGDTIGRKIGGMIMIPKNMIILFALSRIVFFPTTFIIGYKY